MIPRTSRCIYWFKDRGIESGRKAWRDMRGIQLVTRGKELYSYNDFPPAVTSL